MSTSIDEQIENTAQIAKRKKSLTLKIDQKEKEELMKNPYVKQILIKCDILKDGIKTERNKNKLYESQIKQLEGELKTRTDQIQSLTQAKMNIEQKLALERKQLEKKEEGFLKMASILNSAPQNSGKFFLNPNKMNEENRENNKNNNKNTSNQDIVSVMANEEIMKLNEEITKLKFDNETIKKRMNISLEENENRKLEYKTIIKAQTDKIKSLEEELKRLKNEKSELEKKIALNTSVNQIMKEREHYTTLLNEYKKSKDEAIHQMNACLEKCSKLVEENQEYKDRLSIYQSNATKMAEKLTEYKNMLIKVNLRNQMFHVIKLGLISNSDIDIYFGQDKDGNYVMRIDDKDDIELINIEDVEYITRLDENKNKVQISYMFQSKKIKINVLVDDYIIEQFLETYRNFYSESVKVKNRVHY